ncbi:MAG: hypothetical protein IGS03_02625 [Candidatus Sericytochromatia bacterium]|nr:hypothetical protein [Candidatus Sericytochromatia bacterium]
MTLNFELAHTHYQIQRWLELMPGSQAYTPIAEHLGTLPPSVLLELFSAYPETYRELIPLSLMAGRFQAGEPDSYPPALHQHLTGLFEDFSLPLIQEQEHLLKEQKLFRYPFARQLILDELTFHRHWIKSSVSRIDRDRFRFCLSAYVCLLQAFGNPYLLQIWQETGWLQRWQIAQSSGRPLPVQSSPKNSISKYKLSESSKMHYKSLEQTIPEPTSFFEKLGEHLNEAFAGDALKLNDTLEPRLREWVQLSMRHVMKKSFRVPQASQFLLTHIYRVSKPANTHQSGFVLYSLTQELLLGTQNLSYRLNDVIQGLAQGLAELNQASAWSQHNLYWVQQAILDLMMEIYESFSLCDSTFRSFVSQYSLAEQHQQHHAYQLLSDKLSPLFAGP